MSYFQWEDGLVWVQFFSLQLVGCWLFTAWRDLVEIQGSWSLCWNVFPALPPDPPLGISSGKIVQTKPVLVYELLTNE